jgi:hypothetical protein
VEKEAGKGTTVLNVRYIIDDSKSAIQNKQIQVLTDRIIRS